MTCSKCGGMIGSSDPSCPHCGAPLEVAKKDGGNQRRGLELLFAFTAALVLAGVIFACSYFLPIYFKGLPDIAPIAFSKEEGDLYLYSSLHTTPKMVTQQLSPLFDTVYMSDNGRFMAFVEQSDGVETLRYLTVDKTGEFSVSTVETNVTDITITHKGDKIYYCKDGYLFRYENGMSTKLYQHPINGYQLSDTQSVVLFTTPAASGSEYEDLYLLDFAQSDIRVTPVDQDVTKIDSSLQTKRFGKIAYAKAEESGSFSVYLYENGAARLLAKTAEEFYISTTGDILFTRKSGTSVTYSRFVQDDMADVDKAISPDSPEYAGVAQRNALRDTLRTQAAPQLFDVVYSDGKSETLVCQGAAGIHGVHTADMQYLITISTALQNMSVPLSKIDPADPMTSIAAAIEDQGTTTLLYKKTASVATLAHSSGNTSEVVTPSTDWKSFYILTTQGTQTGTLSVITDTKSVERKQVDSNVESLLTAIGYNQLLYLRDGDLYAYDGSFSKVLATQITIPSVSAQKEGTHLLLLEHSSDGSTGNLTLIQGDKKYLLGTGASGYDYCSENCIYYTVPTIGQRCDIYVSDGKGGATLLDRDVLKVFY